MKLYQVLGLPQVYPKIADKQLPFSIAYKFSKLAARANTELEFYQTSLKKIIDEYGERDENGELVYLENGDVRLKAETLNECNERINELSSVEVDIDITFTPEELDSLELSINELQNFIPFIQE